MKKTSVSLAPMAWVEINTAALRHNYREARRLAQEHLQPRLNRDVELLSVVKADAYGHGMLQTVKALIKEGARFFVVSNLIEAMELRQAEPRYRILMLEAALPSQAGLIVKHKITPVISTIAFARALDRAARQAKTLMPVHIEIDTGMGRLGILPPDVPDLVERILTLDQLFIEGFMTHFPVADSDRKFTEQQIERFSSVVAELIRVGVPFRYLHAANSMGVAGYANRYFNLARPGIMLYGLYPNDNLRRKVDLKPAMTVKTRVLLVKDIRRGQGVSYGHTFHAARSLRAAVIAIGYSDGYRRTFSNKAHVLINGKPCRVLGRVTMDQTMVDISRAGAVAIGDEVVVAGNQGRAAVTLDQLAEWAGTIHYEIACNLGNRLPRVYR